MFKLSLREMFLLVTMAGIGCAWWIQKGEVHRLRNEIGTERRWKDVAEQHEQFALGQMCGMADAAKREGLFFFADAKHGLHGARLVRLDVNESTAEVFGQTP
jgi:hypothetical protein